ncbi:4'-phosphopantetheinyl transferase [Streptomyces sp. NRRL S-87]|uniref:4'-phosphopantetheinyl transferase family protein n=1 Tax=Streptomyces sp. NRRL S-87 TaxID=1463920 RepID=UPI0004C23A4A|nr:4'-phosphopantetheinyl transferase superfamily protein [Streptomyces sp. NRRL S-87]
MIERILPPAVASSHEYADVLDAELYPEELTVAARQSAPRRGAFTTGRHCARRALHGLGVAAGPLPVGAAGEPLWPAGVAGAITHCDGYRAAAAARTTEVASLGIDAEPHAPLSAGVLAAVALPHERDQLRVLARARPALHWDKVLFSAKESVYKAWFPLTGRWLDFAQATVRFAPAGAPEVDAHTGRFSARLLVAGPRIGHRRLSTLEGRWLVAAGLVMTAVTV